MGFNPKEQYNTDDFIALKNRVKEEMGRRSIEGKSVDSLSTYNTNYTDTPDKKEKLKITHLNEILSPLNAILNRFTLVKKGDKAKSMNNLNTVLDAHKTISDVKTPTETDCTEGSCAGLCSTGCFGTCKGSCSGNCTGSCSGSCSGGCSTGCTGGCDGSCDTECDTGCSGGCEGTAKGSSSGGGDEGETPNPCAGCDAQCAVDNGIYTCDCESGCWVMCQSGCSDACSTGAGNKPNPDTGA